MRHWRMYSGTAIRRRDQRQCLRHRLDQVRIADAEHGYHPDRGKNPAGGADRREDKSHQPAPGEQQPDRHHDIGYLKNHRLSAIFRN